MMCTVYQPYVDQPYIDDIVASHISTSYDESIVITKSNQQKMTSPRHVEPGYMTTRQQRQVYTTISKCMPEQPVQIMPENSGLCTVEQMQQGQITPNFQRSNDATTQEQTNPRDYIKININYILDLDNGANFSFLVPGFIFKNILSNFETLQHLSKSSNSQNKFRLVIINNTRYDMQQFEINRVNLPKVLKIITHMAKQQQEEEQQQQQ